VDWIPGWLDQWPTIRARPRLLGQPDLDKITRKGSVVQKGGSPLSKLIQVLTKLRWRQAKFVACTRPQGPTNCKTETDRAARKPNSSKKKRLEKPAESRPTRDPNRMPPAKGGKVKGSGGGGFVRPGVENLQFTKITAPITGVAR